ncbi:phage tail sheath subtilisin-like domain-containing protein [Burkholderia dolosa]|uniref:phage tail sheath subtilisin-like domain-containing protein n=1 Tax=Burkholderia dolosa TaxID=152500 RepID=UPI001B989C9F|nr:phage tail sheath subtilisin-like domain-containing protein [Burkholderia dolosa]MBR8314647.1 phage tail sheath subtilisin-like domain-containing protein [Burkholderia dolosa]
MAQDQFLHGIEIVQIDDGARPIQTVRSSVIGVIGTAPDADPAAFPLNTPTLIAGSRLEAAKLDTTGEGNGTLPAALVDIFDQIGAMVVVIRVAEGEAPEETKANIVGGVDVATGKYTGIQAFLSAESVAKVAPKILIAPGFTHDAAVVNAMLPIANRLRAMIYVDGPNTNDTEAITYRETFSSKRIYLFDPWVKVFDTIAKTDVVRPASARFAGLRARVDNERGWWWSLSNNTLNGVVDTARTVEFTMGDPNSRANLLNEKQVTTVIAQDGFRAWGNRTCSSDQKWAFEQTVRTADMIEESIWRAHLWAVDRNITKTYVADVTDGVNAYLRYLTGIGAILGGTCWADSAANPSDQIKQGKIAFDFDFSSNYPAEHIIFRSHLVDTYIQEIFA